MDCKKSDLRVKQFCPQGHDTFLPDARTPKGRCKLCKKIWSKRWCKKNPEKMRIHRKKWRIANLVHAKEWYRNWIIKNPDKEKRKYLKYKYKISLETFNKMFEEQKGKCLICDIHQDKLKKSLCVDHSHVCCVDNRSCGKCVRGLLCDPCNLALGHLEINFKKVVEYLNKRNYN